MFVGPTGARPRRNQRATRPQRPRATVAAARREQSAALKKRRRGTNGRLRLARRRTGTRRQGPRERRRQGRPRRGGGKGKGRGKGGKGKGKGKGGAKGGAKVVVEPHRHEGVFIARGKEDVIVTFNSTPGKDVSRGKAHQCRRPGERGRHHHKNRVPRVEPVPVQALCGYSWGGRYDTHETR